MNRAIKFRGKRVDNGKWVYGNIQIPSPPFDKYIMWDDLYQCEVNPATVGQYTGLKDKNGVKIFEGDIVEYCLWGFERHTYAGGVVVWSNSSFCISDDNNLTEPAFLSDCVVLEVIGNIFDTPQLLEGGGE